MMRQWLYRPVATRSKNIGLRGCKCSARHILQLVYNPVPGYIFFEQSIDLGDYAAGRVKESRDSKPPFGEFSPDTFFDRARSPAPVSFSGPVYSSYFGLESAKLSLRCCFPKQCRYPHFISRESFSVFSRSFHAVYSSK